MRYPALTALMLLHYIGALVVGVLVFVPLSSRFGAVLALLGAVLSALVAAGLGDLLRLLMDAERALRVQTGSSAALGQPATNEAAPQVGQSAFERLDAAANKMFDRIGWK